MIRELDLDLVDKIAVIYIGNKDDRSFRKSCGKLIIGIGSEISYRLNSSGSAEIDKGNTEISGDPFTDLKILTSMGSSINRHIPVIGYISYESLIYSEPSLKNKIPKLNNEALAEYFIPRIAIEYNSCNGDLKTVYSDRRYRELLDIIMLNLASIDYRYEPISSKLLFESHTKKKFIDLVNRAKKNIIDGEVFQIVLSRFKLYRVRGDIGSLLSKILLDIDSLTYIYYIDTGSSIIIGSSPETLIRSYGTAIETYPIAGTRRRIANMEKIIYRKLISDPKERAEHMMLVDLARNDLGKVAVEGSVRVEKLMYPQILPNVIHIVSKVICRVERSDMAFDAFRSLFPAGTVTGAPKPRAMHLIGEYEGYPRGIYAGAVGFARKNHIDFAITIRTAVVKNDIIRLQAGAGIVYDSKPELEYLETENKMRILEKHIRGDSYENSFN